jgi:hypothetical protein
MQNDNRIVENERSFINLHPVIPAQAGIQMIEQFPLP